MLKQKKKKKTKTKQYVIQFFVIFISCTIFLGSYVTYKYIADYLFRSLLSSIGQYDPDNDSGLKDAGIIRNDVPISNADKNEAIALLRSKFTIEEITRYLSKAAEGKISEVLPEIKEKLKERCTEEELEKIRGWYEKYTR